MMATQHDTPDDEALNKLISAQLEPAPSAKTSEVIRRAVKREPEAQTSLTRTQRISASTLLSISMVASMAALGLGVPPTLRAFVEAAGWLGIIALIFSVALGNRGSHSRNLRASILTALPFLFFTFLATNTTGWLPIAQLFSHPESSTAVQLCAGETLLVGAFSAAGIFYIWRGTDPFNPSLSGAFIGLASGLAGALSVGLVCPSGEGWHLWLGHGLTILTLLLVGGIIGRRVLSP